MSVHGEGKIIREGYPALFCIKGLFLISALAFGADLDSLGIVCDRAGRGDGDVAVGTYKKGKGESLRFEHC